MISYQDDNYLDFMLNLFKSLNPVNYHAGELIYSELDDVDMVLFVMKGGYRAGYVIN